jgi:predicted secreted protein
MKRWGLVLRCLVVASLFVATRGVVEGQTGAVGGKAEAAGVTVVTGQTNGNVSLKVGSVLEVRLEANHTTGYSWIAAPVTNPVLMRQGAAK